MFCQARKTAMLPIFDERKAGAGYVMSKSSTPCWKMQKESYFALTSGERSAIILGRNKENVRYGRFSVDKRFGRSFIDSRCTTIWKLHEKTPIGRFLQEGCFMSNTWLDYSTSQTIFQGFSDACLESLFYFWFRTLKNEWTRKREYPAQISVHLHASAMGNTWYTGLDKPNLPQERRLRTGR